MVIVVVFWVLDMGLGVDVALRSGIPARATALLMAQELLQYRLVAEAQEAWLNRLPDRKSVV